MIKIPTSQLKALGLSSASGARSKAAAPPASKTRRDLSRPKAAKAKLPAEVFARPEPDAPVSFRVQGRAVPKERARVVFGGTRVFTPDRTAAWSKAVSDAARPAMDGRAPFSGPLAVRMVFFFPIPASWPETDRLAAERGEVWPTMRPDLDNVVKSMLDACNGLVMVDDAQIVRKEVEKRYGAPRVEVEFLPVPGMGHRRRKGPCAPRV